MFAFLSQCFGKRLSRSTSVVTASGGRNAQTNTVNPMGSQRFHTQKLNFVPVHVLALLQSHKSTEAMLVCCANPLHNPPTNLRPTAPLGSVIATRYQHSHTHCTCAVCQREFRKRQEDFIPKLRLPPAFHPASLDFVRHSDRKIYERATQPTNLNNNLTNLFTYCVPFFLPPCSRSLICSLRDFRRNLSTRSAKRGARQTSLSHSVCVRARLITQSIQALDEEKNKLDAFCEQSLKNVSIS